MSTTYILQMIWLSHVRIGHAYNPYDWDENLKDSLFSELWPLVTIPTLLYTWQYYDMVERTANPKGKHNGFWARAFLVAVAALGTLISTGMNGYYYS
jgi:hypothetical protein